MTSNISNQVAYLRTSREFPTDAPLLSVELSKAYIDTANAVNIRTIGIHAVNKASVGGEGWFLNGPKQQNLRQVFQFTSAGTIKHSLNFNSISTFTKCFGCYTDGTNYYGVIFASSMPITDQVTFWVDPANINVIVDGAAPAVTSGIIVLEWISKP